MRGIYVKKKLSVSQQKSLQITAKPSQKKIYLKWQKSFKFTENNVNVTEKCKIYIERFASYKSGEVCHQLRCRIHI